MPVYTSILIPREWQAVLQVWGITLQIDAGDSRSSRMHSATDTDVDGTSRTVSYLQRIQKQQTSLFQTDTSIKINAKRNLLDGLK